MTNIFYRQRDGPVVVPHALWRLRQPRRLRRRRDRLQVLEQRLRHRQTETREHQHFVQIQRVQGLEPRQVCRISVLNFICFFTNLNFHSSIQGCVKNVFFWKIFRERFLGEKLRKKILCEIFFPQPWFYFIFFVKNMPFQIDKWE